MLSSVILAGYEGSDHCSEITLPAFACNVKFFCKDRLPLCNRLRYFSAIHSLLHVMFQSRACAVLKSRVSLSWRRKTRDALPWQRTTAITCTPARAAFSDGSPPLCAIPPAPGTTLILSQNYRVKRTTGTESGGKNSAQSAARDVVSLVYLCVIMVVGYRKQKTTLFLSDIAEFRKILSTN